MIQHLPLGCVVFSLTTAAEVFFRIPELSGRNVSTLSTISKLGEKRGRGAHTGITSSFVMTTQALADLHPACTTAGVRCCSSSFTSLLRPPPSGTSLVFPVFCSYALSLSSSRELDARQAGTVT
ncbi:hypothetical protein BJV77DRAFT_648425 [Russula vinacea]|nr:hypothetical protein BJV77DRAFT_648425 [Russula vinacea]